MKHICLFLVFLLILLFARIINISGQSYNFKNYTIEQGLPQSTVFCILQDARGYLWTGTENGIARFDGVNFTVFDKSSGLPDNNVRCIMEDHNGFLWIGTDKGIGIYDGIYWKSLTSKNGLIGTAILKLAEDNFGKIWTATNDSGVNIISRSGTSYKITNLNKNKGLSGNFVLDILHDKHGKTWLAMLGGIDVVIFKMVNMKLKI